MPSRRRRNSRRAGAVLILVLLASVLVAVVVAELSFTTAVDERRIAGAADRLRLRRAVDSLVGLLTPQDLALFSAARERAVDGREPAAEFDAGGVRLRAWVEPRLGKIDVNRVLEAGGPDGLAEAIRRCPRLARRRFPGVRPDLRAPVYSFEAVFEQPVAADAQYGPTERNDHFGAAFTLGSTTGHTVLLEARVRRARLWVRITAVPDGGKLRIEEYHEIDAHREDDP